MSQFYCRENDLILFHTSSSSLPKLPDQSTALLYLRLLRHSFVILKSADVFFLNVLLQFYLLLKCTPCQGQIKKKGFVLSNQ